MLHLWQMAKTYMSNQLLVCMCMDAPFPPDDLFMFVLSLRLTTKAYFSIQLFAFMAIAASVHPFNNLRVYFDTLIPTLRSTSLLLYIYTQIYLSINIYLFSLIFPSGKTRTIICQLV